MQWFLYMEEYSSGRRGRSAKALGLARGARVRIPLPPPILPHGVKVAHEILILTVLVQVQLG